MKSFFLFSFFILFSKMLNAQINIKNPEKLLEKINGQTLNIVTSDTLLKRLYDAAFKGVWNYGPIVFLKEESFLDSVQYNKMYLMPFEIKVYNENGHVRKKFTYLTMFSASKSYINVIKKGKELQYSTVKACNVSVRNEKFFKSKTI